MQKKVHALSYRVDYGLSFGTTLDALASALAELEPLKVQCVPKVNKGKN